MERKEVIASKKWIPFYSECYGRFGYTVASIEKIDRNYTISFLRESTGKKEAGNLQLSMTEEKLRMIELASRKKCGFRAFFLNLTAHVCLFCVQGAVLYRLRLDQAHPRVMLQIGIILFLLLLAGGLILKLIESFRWDRVVKLLKKEVLETPIADLQEDVSDFAIVSVLFTREHGFFPELIYWVSGRQFTHASLGLGKQQDVFYSFNCRGFKAEHPAHRKLRNNHKESLCYQFKVTWKEYHELEQVIQGYLSEQNTYRYNYIGALFSIFHIYMPVKSRKVYFCSEFVSEQLRNLDSFQLRKSANMYLPTNLAKSLIQQKNLYKVLVNEV